MYQVIAITFFLNEIFMDFARMTFICIAVNDIHIRIIPFDVCKGLSASFLFYASVSEIKILIERNETL